MVSLLIAGHSGLQDQNRQSVAAAQIGKLIPIAVRSGNTPRTTKELAMDWYLAVLKSYAEDVVVADGSDGFGRCLSDGG